MGTVNGGSTASASLILQSTSGAGTSDYIALKTASQSERLRVDTNGNVAIGTTTTDIETLGANYRPILSIYNPTPRYPGTINIATQSSSNLADEAGRIHILNGTNRLASIVVVTDTASNNNGRFSIWTMGTGVGVEAVRIDSAQMTTFFGELKLSYGNTTGAGSAALGANSPAGTLTAPYTWITVKTSDGSTGYIPVWK